MSFIHKKYLGQNFLKNNSVVSRIIDAIDRDVKEVFEIGPGMGALTKVLLLRGYKVNAVEIDAECCDFLKKNYESLNIIQGDVLQYDIPESSHVIGNLPYNIGTKIIEKFLYKPIASGIFMLQKEVAQRILGNDYCRLSVIMQAKYNIRKVLNVSKSDFTPKPKVESQVIYMEYNKQYEQVDFDLLIKLTKVVFQHPRKKLTFLKHFPKIQEKFEEHDISLNQRAGEISKEVFYKMCSPFNK